ncbi:hypothetical protein QUF31_21345 [Dickeya chrysanthemi]|uniref:hypothetical protein n=1 Tax=Dickeya chrysanthemi TaxID=556 RepID=UPI0025A0BE92|nr:hypothetical protein [Dickeya chrysanthemi]WJM85507.1 hypothetical protein QUF31_21345 [Dickeya chrysanthemi]
MLPNAGQKVGNYARSVACRRCAAWCHTPGLARELLGDIRSVVQSLRDDAGLDLHTALHALAAPFPKPVLQLQIDPAVRVSDPQIAEALLRLVQEALTNAARHGEADTVQVSLHTHDGQQRIIAAMES